MPSSAARFGFACENSASSRSRTAAAILPCTRTLLSTTTLFTSALMPPSPSVLVVGTEADARAVHSGDPRYLGEPRDLLRGPVELQGDQYARRLPVQADVLVPDDVPAQLVHQRRDAARRSRSIARVEARASTCSSRSSSRPYFASATASTCLTRARVRFSTSPILSSVCSRSARSSAHVACPSSHASLPDA